MSEHRPFIATYIMASRRNGTLYVGVTSDLYRRVAEHRQGRFDGFSQARDCVTLVWFEQYELIADAIRRENRLKHWLRDWKLALIEKDNPDWRDLAADWFA